MLVCCFELVFYELSIVGLQHFNFQTLKVFSDCNNRNCILYEHVYLSLHDILKLYIFLVKSFIIIRVELLFFVLCFAALTEAINL